MSREPGKPESSAPVPRKHLLRSGHQRVYQWSRENRHLPRAKFHASTSCDRDTNECTSGTEKPVSPRAKFHASAPCNRNTNKCTSGTGKPVSPRAKFHASAPCNRTPTSAPVEPKNRCPRAGSTQAPIFRATPFRREPTSRSVPYSSLCGRKKNGGTPGSSVFGLQPRFLGLSRCQCVPVEPKPPSPRTVSLSSCFSSKSAQRKGAITICAIRSPGATVCGVVLWLWRATMISPR